MGTITTLLSMAASSLTPMQARLVMESDSEDMHTKGILASIMTMVVLFIVSKNLQEAFG